jgi:hypothetical protein
MGDYMNKLRAILATVGLVTCLGIGAPDAGAQEEFLVIDGNHWQQLDEAQRVAFISGVMHVLEFERQLKGEAMMADERSFVPHLIVAVQGHSVGDVSVAVTDYYIANPDDLGRPVVATMIRVYDDPAM